MLQCEATTDKNKNIQDYAEMTDGIPLDLYSGYRWRI